MTTYNTRL